MMINCATLLTVNPANDVLHDVSVVISDSRIIDILPKKQSEKYHCQNIIDAQNHIVMPGFVNTHTHIGMAYFKGMADDLSLDTWLTKYIWPAEAKCINQTFVYDASLHGIAEMIKQGTTFFCDMYFLPQQTVKATTQAGIRAVISDIGMDIAIAGVHIPERNFSHLQQYQESVRDHPNIHFCLGVHSVYVCSQETWERAIQTAKEHDLILTTHLCETKKEVIDCQRLTGKSPVQYLYDLGAFEQRLLFAHGVHLSADDVKLIAGTPCSLSANLHSNLKLASGILPMSDYLKHNINVSIGTDSVASNNTLNMSAEISTAAKLFKAYYADPTFLPAVELVRMATINGAKALGAEQQTGSIEIGKYADLICIDVSSFLSQPIYDPYSHVVYSMNSSDISHVVVAGRLLMQDRNLLTIDESAVKERAKINTQKVKEITR